MHWHAVACVASLLMVGGCASSRETPAIPSPGAPGSVTIETKFVEVSQGDLDRLGVEWRFTDDLDQESQAAKTQTVTQP
jgi:hypothetical protein